MSSLLSIDDLGRAGIEEVLGLAGSFLEITRRDVPKVPALRGRTVACMFFEDSTRTRISFETAAKRLSADTLSFSVGSSSLSKGESLLDTARTVEAMGIDALVVRHRSAGAPARVASWVSTPVINAGDGCHEHPTQALLDAFTLARLRGPSLDGFHVAIVGDVAHSRVARSNVKALTALGARITLVAPPTLLPPGVATWPVEVSLDLDSVLPEVDACYLLRVQGERLEGPLFPGLREYSARYGINRERFGRMRPEALVLHPGPANRGVEVAAEVAENPRFVAVEQVRNGVAVRMAVLFLLVGGPGRSSPEGRAPGWDVGRTGSGKAGFAKAGARETPAGNQRAGKDTGGG
ncbi:MAG: aspartate carbamoyltransferase catalytic subunit [Acidimicrobiia bacterium]